MPTQRPAAPAPRERGGVAWDYLSLLLPRQADLAGFGADGWELVTVTAAAGDQAMFYFKRRRG